MNVIITEKEGYTDKKVFNIFIYGLGINLNIKCDHITIDDGIEGYEIVTIKRDMPPVIRKM